MVLSDSPRFLMVRLSAIGDCVETMPLLTAIAARWPRAEIDWVVDCGASQLLEKHPLLRRVFRLPKKFLQKPSLVLGLRREFRSNHYDVAIDPQGLLKSAIVTWISGAKLRIGFAPPQSREQAWRFYHHRVSPTSVHLVDRQLELLGPLGIPLAPGNFGFQPPPESFIPIDAWLAAQQLSNRPFILLNPGAGWASRRWPPDRFASVAATLATKYQIPSVVLWAGDAELGMAEQICQTGGDRCLLAPKTSLLELAALIGRSRLLITGDTGPMHIAAAIGTPTLSLFGTTRAEYSGPYGPHHLRLQKRFQEGSSRERRRDNNDAMQEIEVQDVLNAGHELFASMG